MHSFANKLKQNKKKLIYESRAILKVSEQQGDQLYMAVCFWYLEKFNYPLYISTCSVNSTSDFFTRYQKNTVMFI